MRTVMGSNRVGDNVCSTIFIFYFQLRKAIGLWFLMHFDLNFVAFLLYAAYSVKDITVLKHWVGVIVFARWHLCICFNIIIIAHFRI